MQQRIPKRSKPTATQKRTQFAFRDRNNIVTRRSRYSNVPSLRNLVYEKSHYLKVIKARKDFLVEVS
jgi:hypothetical protein